MGKRKLPWRRGGEVNGLDEKPCVGGERYWTFFGYMSKVSRMKEKKNLRQGSACRSCIVLSLQLFIPCATVKSDCALSSCKVRALARSCCSMTCAERNNKLTMSKRPVGPSAPQSPISGAQQQKTHPERVWGAPKNQENCNLLKWSRPGHTRVTCGWVVQWRYSLEPCQVAIHT